jgi:hypothetical protein
MIGVFFASLTGRGQWKAAASIARGTVSFGPVAGLAPAGKAQTKAMSTAHTAGPACCRTGREQKRGRKGIRMRSLRVAQLAPGILLGLIWLADTPSFANSLCVTDEIHL